VTIAREFRFRSSEVAIRRDSKSGDVILSEVPNLDEFLPSSMLPNCPMTS